jgi:8-oxo-dGTP pyrophosphatase MutT (NUDIX family)
VSPITSADALAAVEAHPHRSADPPDGARPSAVLVTIVDGGDGAEVLLTRRSEALNNHRGEISFPGGRVDIDETFEAAALREAHEEVSLHPSAVTLVGRLDPLSTMVSRSFIVPVVGGVAERPALQPAAAEVERILWVPLAELTRTDTFREEVWQVAGERRPIYFFELDDETIWGATARMLHQLLRVVLGIDGEAPPAW